jgi:hypothetical protein
MNFGNNPPPLAAVFWSKEWAEHVQAHLLWQHQSWKARCASALPHLDTPNEFLFPTLPQTPSKPN